MPPHMRGLPKSVPVEKEPEAVLHRSITHIDPGPAKLVSTQPSPDGSLTERLASYRQFASRRLDYSLRREDILLAVIGELIERVEQLEGDKV